ncbi:MAG: ParB/RepB/Spo0J family partition protein [Pirellulaceae bacterium]
MSKDRRLGRGLQALLGATSESSEASESESSKAQQPPTAQAPVHANADQILRIPIDQIDENPFQPRTAFSETEINSLAESLQAHDILQPILLRENDGRYQLISGERRWRAATQAGWSTIPARIRNEDDRTVAELAIVENLQRKDLNALEKATSFKQYLDNHQCTQDELAKRLSIDRSTIANLIRLLELPQAVQDEVMAEHISAGHARALLPLGNAKQQIKLCKKVVNKGLSVRATEELVHKTIYSEDQKPEKPSTRQRSNSENTKSPHVTNLEAELKFALGTKVDINETGGGKGKIVIHFNSHIEFERLRRSLSGQSNPGVRNAG